jgi:starch synthase
LRVVFTALHFIDYSVHLANALAKLVQLSLVMPRNKSEHILAAVDDAVDLHLFDLPRVPSLSNLATFSRLRNTIHPWFDAMTPLLARRLRLVDTVHDVERHPGHRGAKRVQLIRRLARRSATRLIVHGNALKQMLVEKDGTPPDKIHVIPHGNFIIYRTWGSEEVVEDDRTVLFFGRIWPYKGLEYLIRAEPYVREQIRGVKVVIGGQGEDFRRYEALMENRDGFEVHNEFVARDEAADIFRRASVVVLPYVEASQSGVLAMAYTFGKPVIVTDVGSIPEVVDHGKTGLIVPPGDERALAEAIVSLLQDPEKRREMGRNAYKKATTDLAWDTIARQTVEVYKECLEPQG